MGINNIRIDQGENLIGLSKDDRVHKLILDVSMKHSAHAHYGNMVNITDSELFEIFSQIEHRTYYTTKMPMFELIYLEGNSLKSKPISCLTIKADTIEGLVNSVLIQCKYQYFIFYDIMVHEIASPLFTTSKSYTIRGAFYEDPASIRDEKINEILGGKQDI